MSPFAYGYDGPTLTDAEREEAEDVYDRSLCRWCHGERRKAAHDEETCMLVGYPVAGTVCRPCALADWGDNLLRGTVPLELLEPEDKTYTHRELAASQSAFWVLAGRMPRASFTIAVEYFDHATHGAGIPWHRQCGTCGRS